MLEEDRRWIAQPAPINRRADLVTWTRECRQRVVCSILVAETVVFLLKSESEWVHAAKIVDQEDGAGRAGDQPQKQ